MAASVESSRSPVRSADVRESIAYLEKYLNGALHPLSETPPSRQEARGRSPRGTDFATPNVSAGVARWGRGRGEEEGAALERRAGGVLYSREGTDAEVRADARNDRMREGDGGEKSSSWGWRRDAPHGDAEFRTTWSPPQQRSRHQSIWDGGSNAGRDREGGGFATPVVSGGRGPGGNSDDGQRARQRTGTFGPDHDVRHHDTVREGGTDGSRALAFEEPSKSRYKSTFAWRCGGSVGGGDEVSEVRQSLPLAAAADSPRVVPPEASASRWGGSVAGDTGTRFHRPSRQSTDAMSQDFAISSPSTSPWREDSTGSPAQVRENSATAYQVGVRASRGSWRTQLRHLNYGPSAAEGARSRSEPRDVRNGNRSLELEAPRGREESARQASPSALPVAPIVAPSRLHHSTERSESHVTVDDRVSVVAPPAAQRAALVSPQAGAAGDLAVRPTTVGPLGASPGAANIESSMVSTTDGPGRTGKRRKIVRIREEVFEESDGDGHDDAGGRRDESYSHGSTRMPSEWWQRAAPREREGHAQPLVSKALVVPPVAPQAHSSTVANPDDSLALIAATASALGQAPPPLFLTNHADSLRRITAYLKNHYAREESEDKMGIETMTPDDVLNLAQCFYIDVYRAVRLLREEAGLESAGFIDGDPSVDIVAPPPPSAPPDVAMRQATQSTSTPRPRIAQKLPASGHTSQGMVLLSPRSPQTRVTPVQVVGMAGGGMMGESHVYPPPPAVPPPAHITRQAGEVAIPSATLLPPPPPLALQPADRAQQTPAQNGAYQMRPSVATAPNKVSGTSGTPAPSTAGGPSPGMISAPVQAPQQPARSVQFASSPSVVAAAPAPSAVGFTPAQPSLRVGEVLLDPRPLKDLMPILRRGATLCKYVVGGSPHLRFFVVRDCPTTFRGQEALMPHLTWTNSSAAFAADEPDTSAVLQRNAPTGQLNLTSLLSVTVGPGAEKAFKRKHGMVVDHMGRPVRADMSAVLNFEQRSVAISFLFQEDRAVWLSALYGVVSKNEEIRGRG